MDILIQNRLDKRVANSVMVQVWNQKSMRIIVVIIFIICFIPEMSLANPPFISNIDKSILNGQWGADSRAWESNDFTILDNKISFEMWDCPDNKLSTSVKFVADPKKYSEVSFDSALGFYAFELKIEYADTQECQISKQSFGETFHINIDRGHFCRASVYPTNGWSNYNNASCRYYDYEKVLSAPHSLMFLAELDPALMKLVDKLSSAVTNKNILPILKIVSSHFKIERDFGDIYNPKTNATANFLAVFQLDPSTLSEEYRETTINENWEKLNLIFGTNVVISVSEHARCFPDGNITGDATLDSMLCFSQEGDGQWAISSFVFAGD